MIQDLLTPKQLPINSTTTLKISPLNNNCSQLYLQICQKLPQNKQQIFYAQTISSSDFNHPKQNQSILFLKLVLQNCLKNTKQLQKYVKIQKVENLIWEKVIVGKDKIDAALLALRTKKSNKKYEGIAINLHYPQNILLILPKIINNKLQIKQQIKQKTEQQNIKKIFFTANS